MIDSFTGKNRFLSNFYYSPIEFEGLVFDTVEHAYQASKTNNIEEKKAIQEVYTPAEAKKLGRKVTFRANWDEVKLSIMEVLLREKFSQFDLRSLLLGTGTEELIEGNWWGDTYWGICNGAGQNHLGRLLMKIRQEIK